MGCVVSISIHSVQETFPNFLQRTVRDDDTADNADVTQSLAPSDPSHVTLGLVECRID